MGPPPLALGLVLHGEWSLRLAPEAMVRQDGIVNQQPVGQVPVKGRQAVNQQLLMVIDELFFEGTIEAFGVGVHFRGAGISPPVGNPIFIETLLEVAEEFGAIVGEEKPRGCGEQSTQRVEGVRRVPAGRGSGRQGEGEATLGIDEGEPVARSPACSRTTVSHAKSCKGTER